MCNDYALVDDLEQLHHFELCHICIPLMRLREKRISTISFKIGRRPPVGVVQHSQEKC